MVCLVTDLLELTTRWSELHSKLVMLQIHVLLEELSISSYNSNFTVSTLTQIAHLWESLIIIYNTRLYNGWLSAFLFIYFCTRFFFICPPAKHATYEKIKKRTVNRFQVKNQKLCSSSTYSQSQNVVQKYGKFVKISKFKFVTDIV